MKFAIFLFNDDEMCAVHAFLYLKELNENYEAKLILEGRATKFPKVYKESKLLKNHYLRAKENGWIDAVCKACATVTGSLEAVEKEGLNVSSDLSGHVSIAKYINEGFKVLII